MSSLRVAAVWWLVGHLHVTEILPGEGRDGSGVIQKVGHIALERGFSDVKHQQGFWSLVLLTVQNGGCQRGQDELVHLQNKRSHERSPWGLVRNANSDMDRQPRTL